MTSAPEDVTLSLEEHRPLKTATAAGNIQVADDDAGDNVGTEREASRELDVILWCRQFLQKLMAM